MSEYALTQRIALGETAIRQRYEDYTFSDLRFGEVLKDIDLLAGEVAMDYASGIAVTAALNRLDLLAPITMTEDLWLKADLNHVGKSSMEVGVRLENADRKIASAYLTFVALRQDMSGVRRLPEYTPISVEDKRRSAQALARKVAYNRTKKEKLKRTEREVRELTDALCLEEARSMGYGYNLLEMHPQDKNIFGKVFGGYLMQNAYELAHATVREYSGGNRPILASIDRINFLRPVELGSLMRFHRRICYVGTTSVNVEIRIEDADPANQQPVTNSCYFTFIGMDKDFKPKPLPKVKPATPEEVEAFLAGHRRYWHRKELSDGTK